METKFESLSDKILRSYLTLSLMAMLMLGLTLIIFLWMRSNSLDLATVNSPLFEQSSSISTNLQRSHAALRGWVSIGDVTFKQERKEAWQNNIYPAIDKLRSLSNNANTEHLSEIIDILSPILYSLASWQAHIEEVAPTPGNYPASLFLNTDIYPVLNSIYEYINTIVDIENQKLNSGNSDIIYNLMQLQKTIAKAFDSLKIFLDLSSTHDEDQFIKYIDNAIEHIESIEILSNSLTLIQAEFFTKIYSEYLAFSELGKQAIKLRKSDEWNIAKHWLATKAIPLAKKADKIINQVSEIQAKKMYDNARHVVNMSNTTPWLIISLMFFMVLTAIVFARYNSRRLTKPIVTLAEATRQLAKGELLYDITISSNDEIGELTKSFNNTRAILQHNEEANSAKEWIRNGRMQLNDIMRGDKSLGELCEKVIIFLANYLEIPIATLYVVTDEDKLELKGSYAIDPTKAIQTIKIGTNLVGEVAKDNQSMFIENIPENYYNITSSLGKSKPHHLLIMPVTFDDKVNAVIEVATINEMKYKVLDFLEQVASAIGIVINTTITNEKLKHTLDEMQLKSDELSKTNHDLERQTTALLTSEEELRSQREELQLVNKKLDSQKQDIQRKNDELKQATIELETKARDLENSGKYKSEFLANMSHELRTPLNSMLILSKHLADNEGGNLTITQIESLNIISKSGEDLLLLINDILDLSKVEAGKLEIIFEPTLVEEIIVDMKNLFTRISAEKQLVFNLDIGAALPKYITTDSHRLKQILKNFLSNAFKFTDSGQVALHVIKADASIQMQHIDKNELGYIGFCVEDSGIGISKENLDSIFAAFQQADGAINRKFGGTGLGLTISQELSRLIGGEIHVQSITGKGSTFTLWLPINEYEEQPQLESKAVTTDQKKYILVISNDEVSKQKFVEIIRNRGLEVIATNHGRDGLKIAEDQHLQAIILNMQITDMDGITVLNMIKSNSKTRHLPIYLYVADIKSSPGYVTNSSINFNRSHGIDTIEDLFSAIANKKQMEKIYGLVISANEEIIQILSDSIENCIIKSSHDLQTGYELLQHNVFNFVFLDIQSIEDSAALLLNKVVEQKFAMPPTIIRSNIKIEDDYKFVVNINTEDSTLVKEVNSLLNNAYTKHDSKILIVDNDLRNAFVLSEMLERTGMDVTVADSKAMAIEMLNENQFDIAIVAKINDYSTIADLRSIYPVQQLPIVAISDNSDEQERNNILQLGANDYMTKPIDTEKLIFLIKIWLLR